MTNRHCRCDHGFPLCCCALGLTGEALLHQSRLASSIAGWPSRNLDPESVREHDERMARQQRAGKPRIPLGTSQKALPPPDCVPCREKESPRVDPP